MSGINCWRIRWVVSSPLPPSLSSPSHDSPCLDCKLKPSRSYTVGNRLRYKFLGPLSLVRHDILITGGGGSKYPDCIWCFLRSTYELRCFQWSPGCI